jgi:hypothetical protein
LAKLPHSQPPIFCPVQAADRTAQGRLMLAGFVLVVALERFREWSAN